MSDPLKDPAVLEEIFHRALSDADVEGVVAALRLLAVVDPARAEFLLNAVELALAVGGAS